MAALDAINAERETPIRIRQTKYLNNIIEQGHRGIKRRTRPMLGFKNFRCARILLGGIEMMHMIRKGQMQGGPKLLLHSFTRWPNKHYLAYSLYSSNHRYCDRTFVTAPPT